MSYKIVVDSCCELPEEYRKDSSFERVPLDIIVGDYQIRDDESFDQKDFLRRVAQCPDCPKSNCPSPARYLESYQTDADRIYVVTLSSKLSGSFNSAEVAKKMYREKIGEKPIFVVDSESASCGETQIALYIKKLEDAGENPEIIREKVKNFRDNLKTYFVLDNLETLRKNGRLSKVKALVASTLSIKPLMIGDKGEIKEKAKAVGMNKALGKLAEYLNKEVEKKSSLMITHCNAPERAELVKGMILKLCSFEEITILDMAGISSMYANDGGVIVTAF